MKEDKTKGKYFEWMISLSGACAIAFGLGILFAEYLKMYTYWLIVLGAVIHSWGMYKVHKNR